MKKKIYAVKKGWKPGIYFTWLDAYEQIKDYGNTMKIEGFIYQTELKDAGADVEGSLAYALRAAEEYLNREDDEGFCNLANEDLPFDNYEELSSRNENGFLHIASEREEAFKRQQEEDHALFKLLKFNHKTNGNSPLLEVVLAAVGGEDCSYAKYIGHPMYMGRYAATSLYVALLYLALDTDTFFDNFFRNALLRKKERNQYVPLYSIHEEEVIRANLLKTSELKKIKEMLAHMEAIDLNEILYRNGDFAYREENSRLVMLSKTYGHMKSYIKKGNHTVVDLYKELISNSIYRKELLLISGPYENKDIKEVTDNREADVSMKELVLQTNAISMALKESVIGQNEAIEKLEKSYFHKEKMLQAAEEQKGPRNVFLFAGPPGVGKTFMAEKFAENLGLAYKRFDMAGYSSINAAEEIVGISSFYKSAKPGVLTSYVLENPRCVLLFDEIEKAHVSVIRLFLQILDEGVCFDRYYDSNVSFADAIIIFTTNAGKQLYDTGLNENLALVPDQVVYDALKKDMDPTNKQPYFPPEIVSRMSSHTVIMFNHLKASAIRKVIKRDIFKQLDDTKKKYAYDLNAGSDFLAATIQFSEGVNADARNASKLAGKLIDEELYNFLALLEEKNDINSKENIKCIEWLIDFTDASDEIKDFYVGEKDGIIAIFGDVIEVQNSVLENNNIVVKSTTDTKQFEEWIQKENVLLALVDYELGLDMSKDNLSIVDEQTIGRNVYEQLKENHIPTYILVHEEGY
ncbi:MAG: viroplasmin family protein, partial [Agathobacter sp.]|nr:viroplasmin family protein [Agathobacter sp.]